MRLSFTSSSAKLLALAVLCALAVPSVHAADATATWKGNDSLWRYNAQWNGVTQFPNNGNGGLTYNAVINGGNVQVDQNFTVENLTLNGGGIIGGSALTANGIFTWTGGSLGASGTMNANGGVNIAGNVTSNGRVLNSSGVSNWNSGNVALAAGNWLNQVGGTLNINANNAMMSGAAQFRNAGGTVVVNVADNVSLNNSVFNNGTIDIRSGKLTANNFTQYSAGKVKMVLGEGTLKLTGTSALNGVLDLVFADGYAIQAGDTFQVLEFTSLSTQFATVNVPQDAYFDLSSLYTSGTITVGVVPEPVSAVLFLAGGLAMLRRRK